MSLTNHLCERIKRAGPITFHDYMQAALYDPQLGYYNRTDRVRWGKTGDYRTSPETSGLFSATFALYFARLFVELGSPACFTIVEVGAGDGSFAAQVLETAAARATALNKSLDYVIDDISPDANSRARETLGRFKNQVRFKRLDELDLVDSGIVFSNELVDAFPVHRLGYRDGKLFEFYVGLSDETKFGWVEGPISSPRVFDYLKRFQIQPSEGQVFEINLAVEDWLRVVAEKLKQGYLIIVDYGADIKELYQHPARFDGTLRAFRHHSFAGELLNSPGEQDITSTVNWTALKQFGRDKGFELVLFERLDRFLLDQGLLEELERRAAAAETEAERTQLRTSVREMILPGSMASRFQVLVQLKT